MNQRTHLSQSLKCSRPHEHTYTNPRFFMYVRMQAFNDNYLSPLPQPVFSFFTFYNTLIYTESSQSTSEKVYFICKSFNLQWNVSISAWRIAKI